MANDSAVRIAHLYNYNLGRPEKRKIIEEENLLDHVKKMGKYFEDSLKALEKIPIVSNVRGSLFMIGIEPVANKETKELFPAELQIGKMIAKEAHCAV